MKELAKFPELRFLDRFDIIVPIFFALSIFLGEWLELPTLNTNGLQLLIWGFAISTVPYITPHLRSIHLRMCGANAATQRVTKAVITDGLHYNLRRRLAQQPSSLSRLCTAGLLLVGN